MSDIIIAAERAASTRQIVPVVQGQSRPDSGTELPKEPVAKPAPVKAADLERSVERLNDFVESIDRDFRFRVDETTGRTVVTVLNGATNEVIRQIPSEEILRIAGAMAEGNALIIDSVA